MATSGGFLWEDLVDYVKFMLFKKKCTVELGETMKLFCSN
jgi:hypothetical protein